MPDDMADPVMWAVEALVLEGGRECKAIEECEPSEPLDMGVFVRLEVGDRRVRIKSPSLKGTVSV